MAQLPPPQVPDGTADRPAADRDGADRDGADRPAADRPAADRDDMNRAGIDDVWVAAADRTEVVDPDASTVGPATPRPGELTTGWYVVFGLAWLAIAVAFAAVWSASRQIGLSTWWLGPPARPRPFVVNVAPFLAPLLLVAGALNRARYLPWLGLAGAGVTAVFGVGDLGRVRGFGAVELAIAAAGAAVSIAALAGMYRPAR